MTELCEIGFKWGTDKCPQIKHHFTEYYHEIFKDRRNIVYKVVEIGIGRLVPEGVIGASLRMWQEYFPNALVIGADLDVTTLFREERIRTVRCDQRKELDLIGLISIAKIGHDIDLFIDDATHIPEDQIFTAKIVLPYMPPWGIYAIEDSSQRHRQRIIDEINFEGKYECEQLRPRHVKYRDDCLLIFRKKK